MTERRVVLRENKKLLNIVKEIFGDVVEKAYFQESYFGDSDEIHEYALRNLGYSEIKIEEYEINEINEINDSYDLEDGSILIIFKNGKCVEFSCSEWGSIVLLSNNGMDDIQTIVV